MSDFEHLRAAYPVDPAEYVICARRGHTPSGRAITPGTDPMFQVCAWCGIPYRWTDPELVEAYPVDIGDPG